MNKAAINNAAPAFPTSLSTRHLKGNLSLAKALFVCLLLSVAFAYSSFATATLELYEVPNPATTVSDASGVVSFTGTINDFSVNVMGITQPALGGPTNPQLYQITTTVTNTSNATATLTILFSDVGFGPVSAIPMAAFSASANGTPAGAMGSVTYATYVDSGNTLFGGIPGGLLTTQTMSGTFTNAMASGPLVSLSSFSLTQVLTITLPAGGTYNGTAQLLFSSAVPEQGASGVLLLGCALAGVELLRRSLWRSSPGKA